MYIKLSDNPRRGVPENASKVFGGVRDVWVLVVRWQAGCEHFFLQLMRIFGDFLGLKG